MRIFFFLFRSVPAQVQQPARQAEPISSQAGCWQTAVATSSAGAATSDSPAAAPCAGGGGGPFLPAAVDSSLVKQLPAAHTLVHPDPPAAEPNPPSPASLSQGDQSGVAPVPSITSPDLHTLTKTITVPHSILLLSDGPLLPRLGFISLQQLPTKFTFSESTPNTPTKQSDNFLLM